MGWYNLFLENIFPQANYSMATENQTQINKQENGSLGSRIEAILFVSSIPVTISQLSVALDTTTRQIEKALFKLEDNLKNRGITISFHRGKVQLTTNKDYSADIEKFLEIERTTKLSRAALETLAIIAYQQPTTRPYVDAIRGVNSEGVIHTLLNRGLIEESGRTEGPGRPILYLTTEEFLRHFGLRSLDDLPPLDLTVKPESESEEIHAQLPLHSNLLKE